MNQKHPQYVKLRVKVMPNHRGRIVWATKLRESEKGFIFYSVLDKYGDSKNEIIIAGKTDIIWEKPAQMSLKYGELEIKNVVV